MSEGTAVTDRHTFLPHQEWDLPGLAAAGLHLNWRYTTPVAPVSVNETDAELHEAPSVSLAPQSFPQRTAVLKVVLVDLDAVILGSTRHVDRHRPVD